MNTKSILTHPFHLVDKSPWPLSRALSAIILTSGLVYWFHYSNPLIILLGLISIILSIYQWWRDVSREASFQGLHTANVVIILKWGIILFIISEIIFFFCFFWSFFHSRLAPTQDIGASWPPSGLSVLDPFSLPLLNTLILLRSGVTITYAHNSIVSANLIETKKGLIATIILGFYFLAIQRWEYTHRSFNIADSIYGTLFFVTTGFHGLHVFIGVTFITICTARLYVHQLSPHHHFGLEAAAWYWHFVDIVWLFLFIFVYWWRA